MAFEDQTYEVLLHRMMKRVTDNSPNLDTREGSVLFNAHAPAALEMGLIYDAIDNAINESFVATASREYILTHCTQMGMDISVFEAKAGTHLGVFNVTVPIGSRWNCDLYNYVVSEPYDGDYTGLELPGDLPEEYFGYRMICETAGATPNINKGDMTPIDDAPAELGYAKLATWLIQGEDEFTDDEIRQAYYDYVNDTQIDGNIAQYEQWCREFGGIGNYKIFPMWDEHCTNGNVKVSILNEDNTLASEDLIDKFQEFLDPIQETFIGNGVRKTYSIKRKPYAITSVIVDGVTLNEDEYTYDTSNFKLTLNTVPENGKVIKVVYKGGMGNGKAPIGAEVTVTTAKPVKVTLNIILSLVTDNYEVSESDKMILDDAIKNYFAKTAYKSPTISKMAIGAEILKLDIVDWVSLDSFRMGIDNGDFVNDNYQVDYLLRAEEVPVLEKATYTVLIV